MTRGQGKSSARARGLVATTATCLVLASVASLPASAQGTTEQDSVKIVTRATQWLALLDSGNCVASLDSAAPLLREMAGSPDAWGQLVGRARAGFPPTPSRRLAVFDPSPDVPGAPPGRYVRLAFQTAFGSTLVYETVVLQAIGQDWRVAMYGTRAGSAEARN